MSAGDHGESHSLTVVVPTRNRVVLLDRLLHCLSLVDDVPLRVIVVDEASSDSTPATVEAWSDRLDLHCVRNDPPHGVSAARNQGLALAHSRWIAWIDDDDLTSPHRFRRQIDLMAELGVRWSFAGRVDIDDDLRVVGAGRLASSDHVLERLLSSNVIPAAGQGLVVRTDLAREVQGFDETINVAEDWDFCIRLAAIAPSASLDEPLVGYRVVSTGLSSDTRRMDEGIARVLDKHRRLADERGVVPDLGIIGSTLMTAELRGGSRRRCVARMWRTVRSRPTLRNVARLGLIALSPRMALARSAQRRRDQVPAEWLPLAEQWLAPLRSYEGI